ncbi:MBL fold metallo-hydrolase [Desulfacinum hydrothermale]|nr:MBL fold metallo-hydrolase [Desulfacinum hydrothermale]
MMQPLPRSAGDDAMKCTPYDQEKATQPWTRLSELFEDQTDLLRQTLFLQGYDFSSNIYVVEDDGLTVIDPGNDYTAFLQFFDLGFDPEKVKQVWITHGHFDHAMGVLELAKYKAIREKGTMEAILHEAGPEELKKNLEELGLPVRLIQGGETLSTGRFQLEAIHTPGHTADGICLYHRDSGVLFSGDAVLPHGLSAPDKHAGGRLDHLLFSLRRLLDLPVSHLLPGHGWPVKDLGKRVIEASYEEMIKHMIGAEGEVSCEVAARHLIAKGLLVEALYCADKTLRFQPQDAQALRIKVMCLNDMGRFDESLAAVSELEALAASCQEADPVFLRTARGYALMGLERYDEALDAFDALLRENPALQDVQMYKAMALYLSGRQEEALDIEVFQKEFVGRFKEEILKKAQAQKESTQSPSR